MCGRERGVGWGGSEEQVPGGVRKGFWEANLRVRVYFGFPWWVGMGGWVGEGEGLGSRLPGELGKAF